MSFQSTITTALLLCSPWLTSNLHGQFFPFPGPGRAPAAGGGCSGLVCDSFDRANGGLGASWTTVASEAAPQISGNGFVTNGVGSDSAAFYSGVTWPNDHYSQVRVITANTANTRAVCGATRIQAGSHQFYRGCVLGPLGAGATCIIQPVPGYSTVASGTCTVAANDRLRLSSVGSTHTITINGASVGVSGTDATYAAGNSGIAIYVDTGSQADAKGDDYEGGPAS